MSEAFGAYDTAGASAHVPDGTYAVTVRSVQVVKRNGEPVRDVKSNKVKVAIEVVVADGPHAGVALKRTTTIAYGQNSETGSYAAFAQFLEAASGVKCGDPEQKKLGEADVKGRPLIVSVLENSKGYADIVRFKQSGVRAAERAPRGDVAAPAAAPSPSTDVLALLTAGQRNVVESRAALRGINVRTDEGAVLLRDMVRAVMGGAGQLDAAHIPALLAHIQAYSPEAVAS